MLKKYLFLPIIAVTLALSFNAQALKQKEGRARDFGSELTQAFELSLDDYTSLFHRLPGNTLTNHETQRGVIIHLNTILSEEGSCRKTIKAQTVTNTRVIGDWKSALQSYQWSEEWTIRACNKTYKIVIAFARDYQGGKSGNFKILSYKKVN